MKLVLKNTESFVNARLNIRAALVACKDSFWHYHSQYELIYISESSGVRFVGDNVSHFLPGDLVLVGPFLPHLWRNDPSYYDEDEDRHVKTIILKFTKNFLGEGTFNNPEFSSINHLLEQSKFGVSFGKNVSDNLHTELIDIVELSPAEQSIKLLDLLRRLSLTGEREVLSSSDMSQLATDDSGRLDTVIKFISDNYADYISLAHVADIACMTTNSFCRFFKKMTNKSFTEFLNEVRIRNASRLLVQEDLPVSEVSHMVGYKSITNFNKQFKQIMGSTPKSYKYSL